MNDRKYHFILVLISVVIAATLAIQIYWNYNNFQESKRELVADLQNGLDQSVDAYYERLLKDNKVGIVVKKTTNDKPEFKEIFKQMDSSRRASGRKGFNLDNLISTNMSEILITQGNINMDSLNALEPMKGLWSFPNYNIERPNIDALEIERFFSDQQNLKETMSILTAKMVLSIKEGNMNLSLVDSLLSNNLKDQGIDVDYKLYIADTDNKDFLLTSLNSNELRAKSQLLPNNDALILSFTGLSPNIYKLNLTGIILSALLIAAVVLCLFYLLQIIKKQKALGEMKNDLISNITHEFKTPIATASAALEGVQSFTNSGDLDKTDRYLSMGRDQLVKLNGMVERILETATLDSKELMLQKSSTDLNEMIEMVVSKHQNQTSKTISFKAKSEEISVMVDAFHLENAINNLIDNAIKYGGDQIDILLENHPENVELTITDSGNGLTNKDAKLIFDKFYRVAKGNRHDVKGFGIGLFYTKSIIEKHNGMITATAQPQTTFNITLPYE
ncbi:sensor histidine kinase [Nonlabens sp.]|uniref:sensor histidine kinase n=1 Tax=Nonlabens sp. TaxID=1888209 RepID=UPI003F6A48F8